MRYDAPCEPARNIVLKRTNIDGTETNLKTENDATELSHSYTLQKEDNSLQFYCDIEGRESPHIHFNVQCKLNILLFMCKFHNSMHVFLTKQHTSRVNPKAQMCSFLIFQKSIGFMVDIIFN